MCYYVFSATFHLRGGALNLTQAWPASGRRQVAAQPRGWACRIERAGSWARGTERDRWRGWMPRRREASPPRLASGAAALRGSAKRAALTASAAALRGLAGEQAAAALGAPAAAVAADGEDVAVVQRRSRMAVAHHQRVAEHAAPPGKAEVRGDQESHRSGARHRAGLRARSDAAGADGAAPCGRACGSLAPPPCEAGRNSRSRAGAAA
jgi:hypothetical protein